MVYHSTGGEAAELRGHPYAIACDLSSRRWSAPVRLGSVRGCTNDTWSGSHVTRAVDGSIIAYLTVGTVDGANLRYGVREIELWCSRDEGVTWQRDARLVPESGLLYNNPKPVERCLTLFGWQGPGGLEQPQRPFRPLGSSGRAYLWLAGEWL